MTGLVKPAVPNEPNEGIEPAKRPTSGPRRDRTPRPNPARRRNHPSPPNRRPPPNPRRRRPRGPRRTRRAPEREPPPNRVSAEPDVVAESELEPTRTRPRTPAAAPSASAAPTPPGPGKRPPASNLKAKRGHGLPRRDRHDPRQRRRPADADPSADTDHGDGRRPSPRRSEAPTRREAAEATSRSDPPRLTHEPPGPIIPRRRNGSSAVWPCPSCRRSSIGRAAVL